MAVVIEAKLLQGLSDRYETNVLVGSYAPKVTGKVSIYVRQAVKATHPACEALQRVWVNGELVDSKYDQGFANADQLFTGDFVAEAGKAFTVAIMRGGFDCDPISPDGTLPAYIQEFKFVDEV